MGALTVQHGIANKKNTLKTSVEKMLCPVCRRHVFSCDEVAVRLKTRILIFESGTAYSKCRYCKNDLVVPLVMNESADREWLPVWNEARDGEAR